MRTVGEGASGARNRDNEFCSRMVPAQFRFEENALLYKAVYAER